MTIFNPLCERYGNHKRSHGHFACLLPLNSASNYIFVNLILLHIISYIDTTSLNKKKTNQSVLCDRTLYNYLYQTEYVALRLQKTPYSFLLFISFCEGADNGYFVVRYKNPRDPEYSVILKCFSSM